jgi:hypothetical protein
VKHREDRRDENQGCYGGAKQAADEVRFEEGGAVIYMRKSAGEAPKLLAKDARENSAK